MSTSGLVSIVVPAYNAVRTLGETLQSVLAQSYDQFRVLVIDDGSAEPSRALVESIGDPRLNYRWKENSGVSDTRNQGLLESLGEYVLFLDADDLLDERFLTARVDALRANRSLGGCASAVVLMDESGRPTPEPAHRSVTTTAEILDFAPGAVTCPSGYLFRRSVLAAHDLSFDTRLTSSADRFFLLRFLHVASIARIEGAPLLYRVSEASMSRRLSPDLVIDRAQFIELVRESRLIPRQRERSFLGRQYYTLAATSLYTGAYLGAFRHALRAATISPTTFARLLLSQTGTSHTKAKRAQ